MGGDMRQQYFFIQRDYKYIATYDNTIQGNVADGTWRRTRSERRRNCIHMVDSMLRVLAAPGHLSGLAVAVATTWGRRLAQLARAPWESGCKRSDPATRRAALWLSVGLLVRVLDGLL